MGQGDSPEEQDRQMKAIFQIRALLASGQTAIRLPGEAADGASAFPKLTSSYVTLEVTLLSPTASCSPHERTCGDHLAPPELYLLLHLSIYL